MLLRPVVRSVLLTTAAVFLLGTLTIWTVDGPQALISASPGARRDGVKEFSIRVYAWGFSPKVIRVDPGETVRFRVVSDDIQHGFAINELGLNLQLVSGREVRSPDVKVALPPGKYPIQCSTFCGLGHPSMKASLVVGDPGPTPAAAVPWIASLLALAAAGSFAALAAGRREPGP